MELLLEQIKQIIDKDLPLVSNLSNISSILFKLDDINWAGFYIAQNDKLYLGPFQGDIACTIIPKGKGVCGKFVYDSTANTIRLPKITGFIEGTIDPTALGELLEAGLPNITGSMNSSVGYQTTWSGAFSGSHGQAKQTTSNGSPWEYDSITFNASRCSSVYGKSNTVQPQSIKVFYYIVIATSVKTNVEVNLDNIANDLNHKIDASELSDCEVVLETYRNGTSWYRVWSDGWIEQGGYDTGSSNAFKTITLLKAFSDTNYMLLGAQSGTNTGADRVLQFRNKSTTSFDMSRDDYSTGFSWYACGY